MSSGPNQRREHERIPDHGPAYESRTPAKGCNSTHVARSRGKWKARASRAERRTGERWGKFQRTRYSVPSRNEAMESGKDERSEGE
jgi:hypothetical protein